MTADSPGAIQCMFCGKRREMPGFTLAEVHASCRDMGLQGRLNEDRTAVAAICPTCHDGTCPDCGKPVADHQDHRGKVTRCDGSRR